MTFGALFTLRTRDRQARPQSTDEAFPASAGWNERRAQAPDAPAPGTPRRRSGGKPREPRQR